MTFSCNHFFAFAIVLITEGAFKKFVCSRSGKESLFYDISIILKQTGGHKFEEFKSYFLNVP